MTISGIERRGSLMIVTFENGETFSLPRSVMREHPLREGQAFDADSYLQKADKTMYQKALERAVWWLSRKDYSEKQLMSKLKSAAFSEDSALRACAFLKAGNYLSDARLSENLVRQKMKSSGSRRIAMTLRQKGIAEETARQALEALEPDEEMETALRLARKYLRGKQLSPQDARRRCGAYLARRGFDWDTIKTAYQRASGDDEEDDFE